MSDIVIVSGARSAIESVARESYSHRRQREYVLTAKDFR